ncbi:MAG: hypothetical protein JWM80_1804 [Cyanobacteria bacterium RYN_339]|nr:hypothetical protein [Cyanobacteria bacterium RYN_339]
MGMHPRPWIFPILAALVATGCGRAPATAVLGAAALTPESPSVHVTRGAPDPAWQRLSAEERRLGEEGLLPAEYPALAGAPSRDAARALGRKGLTGPFADDFGDPQAMLAAARFAHTHAPYKKFLQGLHRGDLVFVASNDPKDFVAVVSGGPFDHVLLCTDPAPPGRFIEAVGITGEPGERFGDRVRRGAGSRYAKPEVTLRIGHVAGGNAQMVEGAIAYATRQLGKPYNYTFSDDLAGDRAFYCSSLVYKAYRSAGLDWHPAKDPARDRVPMALIKTVLALEPDDALAASVDLMEFLHRPEPPDGKALAAFVVDRILPSCKKTRALALTPRQRTCLAEVLARVVDGKALPKMNAAIAKADASSQDRSLGGKLRHAGDTAVVVEEAVREVVGLLGAADVDALATVRALKTLAFAALPYADVLTAFVAGPRSDGAHAAGQLLDWVGRAAWVTLPDLESPTDLAWSLPAYEDYNVKESTPVDTWPFALVPSDGNLAASLLPS